MRITGAGQLAPTPLSNLVPRDARQECIGHIDDQLQARSCLRKSDELTFGELSIARLQKESKPPKCR
jgi:hypothetical protein